MLMDHSTDSIFKRLQKPMYFYKKANENKGGYLNIITLYR